MSVPHKWTAAAAADDNDDDDDQNEDDDDDNEFILTLVGDTLTYLIFVDVHPDQSERKVRMTPRPLWGYDSVILQDDFIGRVPDMFYIYLNPSYDSQCFSAISNVKVHRGVDHHDFVTRAWCDDFTA